MSDKIEKTEKTEKKEKVEKAIPTIFSYGKAPEHWQTKSFAVGEKVKTIAEVNAMLKGTIGVVEEVQFDGAVFKVAFPEQTIRVKADDLAKA